MTDRSAGPPRTSLGVVLGVTGVLAALLLGAVPVGREASVGVLPAVGLAASLWLVGEQHRHAGRTLVASLLAFPIAAGAGLALVWALSALVVASFPVAGPALARPVLVDIGATVLVVAGSLLAVFGATAATRGVVDTSRVGRYAGIVARTALPVTVVASIVLVVPVVVELSSDGSLPFVDAIAGPLVNPVPGRTHLGVFLFSVGVTAWLGGRAVGSLPLAELAPSTPDGPDYREAVRRIRRGLARLALPALFGGPFLTLIEQLVGQRTIRGAIPTVLYDLAVALSGSASLRVALWWTALVSLLVVLAVWLLRRTVRRAPGHVAVVLAPYVGGIGLTAAVLVAGGPAVSGGERLVRAEAPAFLASLVEGLVAAPIEFYGPRAVAVVLTAAALLGLVGLTGALWTVLFVGYVGERGSEAALAGGGLFVATAAAGTLSAPPALVLGGLVAAVVVWDAGAFGATLGRELGAGADGRRTELVHTGGTVAVGCLGAGVAAALTGVSGGVVSVPPGTALVALVVCVVAVLALVAALR